MTRFTTPLGFLSRLCNRLQARLAALVLLTGVLGSATVQAQDVATAELARSPELRFQDFFQKPIGPRGAQFTDTLRQADGKVLRITGYMVQNERPNLGRFMLAPRPVRMSEHADGDADDLPLSWVMVYLDPSQQNFAIPHVQGLIELTGTVQVGRVEETDGRVSWVRLQLPQEATRGMNAFEVARHLHSLQHSH